MAKFISPNSREPIGAYDPILEEFFYVEGTSGTGSINVNAVLAGPVVISGTVAVSSIAAGTNAIGGITLGGSNAQLKDDSFYGEDVTSGIASVGLRLWDGAAYDRAKGDSTNGLLVNLGTNNDVSVTSQVGVANIATGQQGLTTSAAQVVAAQPTRRSVTIVNLSSIDVYVGNTGVTTSTGQLLLGTKGTALTLETATAVFAVAASGTPTVSYLEEYA